MKKKNKIVFLQVAILISFIISSSCTKRNWDNPNDPKGKNYHGSSQNNNFQDGILTDIEGNSYKTVIIGTQVWMAENLKTTTYKDRTAIPLVTNITSWSKLTMPGYCWYNNTIANKDTYGALYNWHTVSTGNLCPTGWHVPTDAEWTVLTTYLGGDSVAGNKLRETGNNHWNSPNTGATNITGFTALPGGWRSGDGTFRFIGDIGYWWSSTEYLNFYALSLGMMLVTSNVERNDYGYYKDYGFSVRCLKD